MTPDPDHLQVVAVSFHVIDCPPSAAPYARYSEGHRKKHERRAHLFLNRLYNAGWTLTTNRGET